MKNILVAVFPVWVIRLVAAHLNDWLQLLFRNRLLGLVFLSHEALKLFLSGGLSLHSMWIDNF